IMHLQLRQRRANVGPAQMGGKLLRRQRLFGGEQRRFHRAHQIRGQIGNRIVRPAHAFTALSRNGPKVCSCAISALPSRASSSAATKLEASADRRKRGSAHAPSCEGGRKSRSSIQSSVTPSIAETRESALSSVIT